MDSTLTPTTAATAPTEEAAANIDVVVAPAPDSDPDCITNNNNNNTANSKSITPFSIADILSKPTPPTPHHASELIQRMLIQAPTVQFPNPHPGFHPWLCFSHPWGPMTSALDASAAAVAAAVASSSSNSGQSMDDEDDDEEILEEGEGEEEEDIDEDDEEFIEDDSFTSSMDGHHRQLMHRMIASHRDEHQPIDMRAQQTVGRGSSNSNASRSRKLKKHTHKSVILRFHLRGEGESAEGNRKQDSSFISPSTSQVECYYLFLHTAATVVYSRVF